MSDKDLGAVIAYLKVAPPVERATEGSFDVMGLIIFGAGLFGNLPVEDVSHAANVTAPEAGVSGEYGQYLTELGNCFSCHGADYAGGVYPDPAINFLCRISRPLVISVHGPKKNLSQPCARA